VQDVIWCRSGTDGQRTEIAQKTQYGGQHPEAPECEVETFRTGSGKCKCGEQPQHPYGEMHDVVEWVDHKEAEQHVIPHISTAVQARSGKPDHTERKICQARDSRVRLSQGRGSPLGLCLDPGLRFSINHHVGPVSFAMTYVRHGRGLGS
jgi:hypothetical protein